jgi:hypothetical protein
MAAVACRWPDERMADKHFLFLPHEFVPLVPELFFQIEPPRLMLKPNWECVLPFAREFLGRLQRTQMHVQLTDLVGCFNVSSGKIYPLLLVSDTTDIEVAPNTLPVEAAAKPSRSSQWRDWNCDRVAIISSTRPAA